MSDPIRDELKDVYDAYADTRNATARPAWKIRERESALTSFRIRRCRRILEIGAGTGEDSLYFEKNGCDVIAVDLSEQHVRLCREKGLAAAEMDVCRMTFADASFDGIYSINCFLHIPKADLPVALAEAHRVLRPQGLFHLGVYGGHSFEGRLRWKDYDGVERFFAFYPFDEYRRILADRFRVLETREVRVSDDLTFHAFLLER